jgi:hypothetical protein
MRRYKPLALAGAFVLGLLSLLGHLPLEPIGPVDRGLVGQVRPAFAQALPSLPAGWPSTLQLGMMDSPGGAAEMRATAPFGFRSQYLAGGANTGGA